MASELIVQTLKGPTSGANANKIIVPSGQTLSAAGHVVQMKRAAFNTVLVTSSSSFVTHVTAQFDTTPTVGNLVIAQARVTANRANATNFASGCTIWINSEGMASGDTDFAPVGAATYAGYDNYGREGMAASYYGNSVTTTGHKTITSSHVSGGNPSFNLKVSELGGGGTTTWGSGTAGSTSDNYATDITSIILWEIAQ